MIDNVLVILATFFIVTFGSWIAIRLSKKKAIKKSDDYRRVGEGNIPLWGGVTIFVGLLFSFSILPDQFSIFDKIIISLFPVLVFGILDDLYEISGKYRLIGHLSFAVIFVALLGPENLIYTKMGLHPLLAAPVSCLFLVTLANAFNFMDGMDGVVCFSGAIIFAFIGLTFPENGVVALVFSVALLGFAVFNFPNAKLYLGDFGSALVGLSSGALVLGSSFTFDNPVRQFMVINFLFALPFIDLVVAVIRRIKKKIPPWKSDREHFHHKLLALGYTKDKALAVMLFITCNAAATSWVLNSMKEAVQTYVLIILNSSLLSAIYFGLNHKYFFSGRKFSYFGRTFLEKYVLFDEEYVEIKEGDHCVMVDLLPHFTELQGKGVLAIDRFVKNLSELVMYQSSKSLNLFGSYTILIFYEKSEKFDQDFQANFTDNIYSVFLEYGTVRTLSEVPEGITFFENLTADQISELKGKYNNSSFDKSAA